MNPDANPQAQGSEAQWDRKMIAGCLALACAAMIVAGLHPRLAGAHDYHQAFIMDDQTREQVNSSPFALILGELRTSAADMMWVKTERYMHRGISFKAHMDADAMASTGEAVAAGAAAGQANAGHASQAAPDAEAGTICEETPLVPDRQTDYRGFIGVIQRNVEPWKGADETFRHASGDELLPWYRVLTLSNPHHVRGYLTGTWWLMKQGEKNPKAYEEALSFIEEGMRGNPESFQLVLMQGRVLLAQEKYSQAVEAFRGASMLALKVRPAEGKTNDTTWTDWEEEDFSAAVHYVPSLELLKLHDSAAAMRDLAWARQLLPESGRLRKLGEQMGSAK